MSVSRRSNTSVYWTAEAWLLSGITVLGAIGLTAFGWQAFAAEVERVRTHAVVLDQSRYIDGCALRRSCCRSRIRPVKCNRDDGDIICDGIFELRATRGR